MKTLTEAERLWKLIFVWYQRTNGHILFTEGLDVSPIVLPVEKKQGAVDFKTKQPPMNCISKLWFFKKNIKTQFSYKQLESKLLLEVTASKTFVTFLFKYYLQRSCFKSNKKSSLLEACFRVAKGSKISKIFDFFYRYDWAIMS